MLATADCSDDAQEAETGQAMLSASCKGALGTAAHTGYTRDHYLDQQAAPSKSLALYSVEQWYTTASPPPPGQLQPKLSPVSVAQAAATSEILARQLPPPVHHGNATGSTRNCKNHDKV